MVRSGFYNSKNHDRQYYNSDMSRLFNALIKDGVFQNIGDKFIARPGTGMQVIIPSGMAYFNSTWIFNDSDYVQAINAAPIVAGFSRIDGIFLKMGPVDDQNERLNSIYYMAGTPASQDVQRPVPTPTDGEVYVPICYVTVNADVTEITASKITNAIGTADCPFVSGILTTVSAGELLTQWEAQWNDWLNAEKTDFEAWTADRQSYFNEWFENLQYVLDGDVAGHLQNEIDELNNHLGVFYDSVAEAEADLENIPDGTMIYTPDPTPDIQDEIDRLTTVHFIDSQVGAGSKNVTIYTASTKRLLVVTKKSGVVVGTKEIPTNVLESGDKIVLGNIAPVIGSKGIRTSFIDWSNGLGKKLGLYSNGGAGDLRAITDTESLPVNQEIGLSADASQADGATLTFNGNNSFTLAVTDSTLSVYLYADMVVLGGSASAMNVAIDLTDTDMSSTNVEDAIKELHNEVTEITKNTVTDSTNISANTEFICPSDGYWYASVGANGQALFYINNTSIAFLHADTGYGDGNTLYVRKGMRIKTTIGSIFYAIG